MSKSSTPTDGYLTDTYKNLEDEIVSLDNFEGSHLLVFDMSTSCGYCIEQHYVIAEIYKMNYTNFNILTLSVDPDENIERMIEYQNSYGNSWPIGIISNGSTIGNLNISAVPTLMLFNSEGRLLSQKIGYTEFEDLNEIISEYVSTEISPLFVADTTPTTSDTLTIGYSAYSVVSLIMFSIILMSVGFRRNKY